MVEQGIVTEVKDGRLIVNIKRHAACGGCRACSLTEHKEMVIEFENTIGARKGEKVDIELDDIIILKGAFLFYIVPLAGLIFGIFAGWLFAAKMALPVELVSASLGIIVMAAALAAVRRYNPAGKERYRPVIKKKTHDQRLADSV
ncbi:MAG: SoxR reducing system RseC family protein [Candidatus Omnitrophica bacterium]|nr:SoxR reducing system RseC family protein [Candidatus Omnitrophota bacterium]